MLCQIYALFYKGNVVFFSVKYSILHACSSKASRTQARTWNYKRLHEKCTDRVVKSVNLLCIPHVTRENIHKMQINLVKSVNVFLIPHVTKEKIQKKMQINYFGIYRPIIYNMLNDRIEVVLLVFHYDPNKPSSKMYAKNSCSGSLISTEWLHGCHQLFGERRI